jgi:N4-gp56 family major capsid protein
MASTTPTNIDTSIPEIWAKSVLRDTLRAGFFGPMTGPEGSGMPIIQKTELLNKPGDTIHIQTSSPLSGGGISGDTAVLAGNEEALALSEILVVPTLYRHAVRMFRRANKKSIVDLRAEAKSRLAEWAEQKMDTLRFAAFVSQATLHGQTYTSNSYGVGGHDGTSLVAADTLSVAALQTVKLKLRNNRAKPLRLSGDGKDMFGIVVHPNALFDLKRESEYRDWVREAAVRGESNPFFQGSTAVIDGMVVFEHENVPTATSGGTGTIKYAKNIAFGAEAFVEGLDEAAYWAEDDFDYGNEQGIAYGFAMEPRRGLEKNSLLVLSAAVDK